jgi:GNAT superfamily N-acetyltransferase
MTPQGAGGGAPASDGAVAVAASIPQAKRVKFSGGAAAGGQQQAQAPPPQATSTSIIPTTPAAEAFSWHLLTAPPGPQLDAEIFKGGREFECEFYHQLVGDDEELVGYFEPRCKIWLHAQCGATWLDAREASPPQGMTAAQRTALARRRRPKDLAEAMREQAYGEGNGLVTSREAFVAAVAEAVGGGAEGGGKTTTKDDEFTNPTLSDLLSSGHVLSTEPLEVDPLATGGGATATAAGTKKKSRSPPSSSTPPRMLSLVHYRLVDAPLPVRRLHARFEPLLLFTVDGANTIDGDDPRWELVLAVLHGGEEGAEKDGSSSSYAIAGLMTLYNFYAYPSGARPRVSQILVLPPLQGFGLGARLLRAAYALASKRGARDLTFEDPSAQLQRVRERLELSMLLERAPWVARRADAALRGVLVPGGGGAGAAAGEEQQEEAPAAAAAAEPDTSAAPPPPRRPSSSDAAPTGVSLELAKEAEDAARARQAQHKQQQQQPRPRTPPGPRHPLALPPSDVDRLARATLIHRAQLPVLWEAILYLRLRAAAESARANWGSGAAAGAAAAAADADENAAGSKKPAAKGGKKASAGNTKAPPLLTLLERGAEAVAALAAARLQAQEGGSAESEAAARCKRVVDIPPRDGQGEEWFMWRAPAGAEGEDEGAAAAMLGVGGGGGMRGGGGPGEEDEEGGEAAARASALARLKAAREAAKRKRGAGGGSVEASGEEEEEDGHVRDADDDEEDEDEDGEEDDGEHEEDAGGVRGARGGKKASGAELDTRVAAALQERLQQLEELRVKPPKDMPTV